MQTCTELRICIVHDPVEVAVGDSARLLADGPSPHRLGSVGEARGHDAIPGACKQPRSFVLPTPLLRPVRCLHDDRGHAERVVARSDRRALEEILGRYGATDARLFGSVARGDATSASDIDLLVDLSPGGGNELLRVSGIAEELTELLGIKVDVVAPSLLRGVVSSRALADAVAV